MAEISCYTDGAYSPLRDKGGIGIVFVKNGTVVYKFKKMFEKTTNNKCEIMAVVYALHAISKPLDKVTIYSDSQYVIGCATLGWKRKKNPEYWALYDNVLEKAKKFCPNIEFKWVKGHTSNKDFDSQMNDLADKLAVEASNEI
jgi:ribonuclease HI